MSVPLLDQCVSEIKEKLNENLLNYDDLVKWKCDLFKLIDRIGDLKLTSTSTKCQSSTSFDPSDWPSARVIAHRIVDSSIDYMEHIHKESVWNPMPNDIRALIEDEPLPDEGQPLVKMYEDITSFVIPYTKGNAHPRYWGWVTSTGTLIGALSDMVSSTLNMNTCSGTHSGTIIERKVIRWIVDIFQFPQETAGGLITSGTSTSTLISLASARQRFLTDVRRIGLVGSVQLVAYASSECHSCIGKALEVLGLGNEYLRLIPVDENFSMKIDVLRSQIDEDRQNGFLPFCIIGSAGTVNTGSFDNLKELAEISKVENLWFHVDGAFGSLVVLDRERRQFVSGIEHADSLAFDFHKWLHIPYDAACVLMKDSHNLTVTFSSDQSYLGKPNHGSGGDLAAYSDMGIELSRSFRALKIWFTLKQIGLRRLADKISENCQQVDHFVSLLENHKNLIEVVRPVRLNIVNFRFKPLISDASIDEFNHELLIDSQISGFVMISSTKINQKFYLRLCICNQRSTLHDVQLVYEYFLGLYQRHLDRISSKQ